MTAPGLAEDLRPGDVRLGVDVGGTFTDLVAVDEGGRLTFAKVPSVPGNQSEGVLSAVARSGVDPRGVSRFAHGTTVATNTLLERNGAVTALVTTAGFRDVLEIGRQDRPALYDLTRRRAEPLVPRERRFTLAERSTPDGVAVPLADDDVTAVADALAGVHGLEAVAVCLLFSFAHPGHERRVGELLRERMPGVTVTLSGDVLPKFREYERFSTTTASAYLAPRLSAYLRRLARDAAGRGLPGPLVMLSSGGVVPLDVAVDSAAACVLSGPAGGVVGAAYVAGLSGEHDLLTFDMGGTSTDVAPVVGGAVQMTHEAAVGGIPIQLPAVDVHSVSAGGGSIAWVDEGGALRVGPRSAGARPGPACYGLGGTEPTVTDANLYLGFLGDGSTLGGDVVLSRESSEKALAAIAERLGLDVTQTAVGVVAVANAEMARALRVVSVERGLDPRDFSLVAFGGAGGMHACALAEELGIRRILVPLACGVLSALGLALGSLRRDYVTSAFRPADSPDLDGLFAGMEENARADLPQGELARFADCRYAGQSFELTVPAGEGPGEGPGEGLWERFEAEHERRYGHRAPGRAVEVVALRLVATVPGLTPALRPPAVDPAARRTRRTACIDGAWQQVDVVPRASLGLGERLDGPAIVEFDEATCVLRPGWAASADDAGTLVVERMTR
jgi:N-methylhydantoinase A